MYQENNNFKSITSNTTSPFIFNKKTNLKYKLVPFNLLTNNNVGDIKYLPPVSKEWKNNVYNYNSNNIINLPIYDLNINSLIKGYFGLYLNHRFLKYKYLSRKKKRKSFNKIYVSKAEIKHTNNQVLITVYVYNKERLSLLKKIKKIKFLFKAEINSILEKWLKFLSVYMKQDIFFKHFNNYVLYLLRFKAGERKYSLNKRNFSRIYRLIKIIKKWFFTIRRLKFKLSLNKYKFEDKFLYVLGKLIGKYYGKKVEFNIVNIKSISYNTDIFTEILTLKLKKQQSSVMGRINSLLAKVSIPEVNRILERGRIEKQVNFDLIENKYPNLNLNTIINKFVLTSKDILGVKAQQYKDNLNKLLYNLYYKSSFNSKVELASARNTSDRNVLNSEALNKSYSKKLCEIIFENIKYKSIGGVRLRVKGRLTKRYRADRAVYKLKWKGGLKNIDSSFKGLSTVVFRGYLDSNVERSIFTSKRRIGSFGVTGWFGGK